MLAWIAFLAPTLLRARNNQVRADSVGDFHHRLRALGGTNGHRKHQGPRGAQPIFGPVSTGPGTMPISFSYRAYALRVRSSTSARSFACASRKPMAHPVAAPSYAATIAFAFAAASAAPIPGL